MGKILKFCNSCEEGFAEKFTFCPDCGSPLEAYEMKPVTASDKNDAVSKAETEDNILEVDAPEAAPETAIETAPAEIKSEPVIADTAELPVTEELPAPPAPLAAVNYETGPLEQPENDVSDNIVDSTSDDVVAPIIAETAETSDVKSSVAAGNAYYTTPEMHADQPRTAAPINYTREDDGGFYVTVIQEKNQKQRNALLLGALGLVLFTFTLAWGISLFTTDLGVGSIDSNFSLARLIDEVPMPLDLEEVEKPKNDKDSGGGGGGGGDEETPTSKGQLAQQNEKPLIAPTKTIVQRDNPELAQPIATTKGPPLPVPRTDERYGDVNARFGTPLSDGTGSQGGQGTGMRGGQGSGDGPGIGTGSNGGRGAGNNGGVGDGDGRGGRPVAPKPPSVTTSLRIISRPRADYTAAAREKQIQGTVRLRVTFLSNGSIGSIQTVKGLPDGLTDQAIAAARRMTFEPKMVDGRPVAVTSTVEYNFNLY